MRKILIAASMSLIAALSAVPSQAAVNTAVAGPGGFQAGYATPKVLVVKSQPVTFVNADAAEHDVVSVRFKQGSTTVPLFKSNVIGTGETDPVVGLTLLPTGDYAFYCSIHPSTMKGTITIVQ